MAASARVVRTPAPNHLRGRVIRSAVANQRLRGSERLRRIFRHGPERAGRIAPRPDVLRRGSAGQVKSVRFFTRSFSPAVATPVAQGFRLRAKRFGETSPEPWRRREARRAEAGGGGERGARPPAFDLSTLRGARGRPERRRRTNKLKVALGLVVRLIKAATAGKARRPRRRAT